MNPLEKDNERVEWINNIIRRGWYTYRKVIATQVVESLQQTIALYKPGFITAIKFPTFDLGESSPLLLFMKGYKDSGDNRALLDINVIFNNPSTKIVVEAHIGPLRFPLEIRNLVFEGYVRLEVVFQSSYPFLNSVGFAFLSLPYFDFSVIPCHLLDILEVPFLHSAIATLANGVIEEMLLDPHLYRVNVDELMNISKSAGLCQGVLICKIKKGEGFPKVDLFGACDPYIKLKFQGQKYKTRVLEKTLHPVWNQTFYLLLKDPKTEKLEFTVYDYNITQDQLLSKWSQDLSMFSSITEDGETESVHEHSQEDDAAEKEESEKPGTTKKSYLCEEIVVPVGSSGRLHCDLEVYKTPSFCPSLFFDDDDDDLQSPSITRCETKGEGSKQKTRSGLLRIGIHAVDGVDTASWWGVTPRIFVRVSVDNRVIFKTKSIVLNDPKLQSFWNEICEALIMDYRTGTVFFEILSQNPRSHTVHKIGRFFIDLRTIVKREFIKKNGFACEDNSEIILGLSFFFVSVDFGTKTSDKVKGNVAKKVRKALHKELDLRKCGILNVTIDRARDLRAADLVGKSDPFVLLKMNNKVIYKTEVKKKTLDPEWKEKISFPIPGLKGLTLKFCIMDWDFLGRNDSLGEFVVDLESELGSSGDDMFEGWMPISNQGSGEIQLSICYDPPEGNDKVESKDNQETSN
ncbi:uncharacterized protein LOC135120519 isoform X2 [Zophobas morio]